MDQSDHDHQSAATSENPSDGEDYQGASTVTSKSYECNFCKRGFSNAQALGGHMNIHRKDKAKLKQQQSLDKVPPPQDHQDKAKWNWNVSKEEQHASSRTIHTKQLPLFVESPTISETQKPEHVHSTTQPALLPTQDSSLKLDLELRLGPEPQDSSAAAAETGTRNFF